MYFPKPKPFIFVHIPRTGGTSIESALCRHLLGKSIHEVSCEEAELWKLPKPGNVHQHYRLEAYQNVYGMDVVQDAFVFSIVRNPWELVVSEILYFRKYHSGVFRGDSWESRFKEYFSRSTPLWGHDFSPQLTYIRGLAGRECDFVGRFDTLQNDFKHVCSSIGIPRLELGRALPSDVAVNYSEIYDDESRWLVAERYYADIAEFGFEFPSEE